MIPVQICSRCWPPLYQVLKKSIYHKSTSCFFHIVDLKRQPVIRDRKGEGGRGRGDLLPIMNLEQKQFELMFQKLKGFMQKGHISLFSQKVRKTLQTCSADFVR